MVLILSALVAIVAFRFRSRASHELKLIALQHQLAVLRRQRPGRPQLSSLDRLLWVLLYRIWGQCLGLFNPSLYAPRLRAGRKFLSGTSEEGIEPGSCRHDGLMLMLHLPRPRIPNGDDGPKMVNRALAQDASRCRAGALFLSLLCSAGQSPEIQTEGPAFSLGGHNDPCCSDPCRCLPVRHDRRFSKRR
jgi:hypothetical protein